VILNNLDKYENLVHRYGEKVCAIRPGSIDICYIELRKENRGRQLMSGLDLG
jgi:iron complex outermembrane receptor protein